MLIHSSSQLLMISEKPQRGIAMGDLGIIKDGALVIEEGVIVDVGDTSSMISKYPNEPLIDASKKVVMPGFVDPHTHAVWAGDRAEEFELKLKGKSYLDILESGGGILSTVKATRQASIDDLIDQTRKRLWQMFLHGSTTIEVKTGYGLDIESEIKSLEVIIRLDEEGPWDLEITFLGGHAIPPEFKNDPDGYTNHVCDEMLPAVKNWWSEHAVGRKLPYVDVFCETGAFDLEQSGKILNSAKSLNFPRKIHSDEFDNLGGTQMAVALGATSADHLVSISEADIKALSKGHTVAVGLPGTPFGLGKEEYTPARRILEAGGLLAIASDLNPGTSWCENMQMAMALACRYMGLTPAQVVVASTINAAAAVGLEEQVGSIHKGKQADILILDIPDYRHLGYRYGINLVDTVIKRGKIFNIQNSVISNVERK